MARKGGNPNIAEAGKNTRFGTVGGYNAVKAQEKSVEAKVVYKSLNADLREQATPEMLAEINKRLLQMAKHGNLKAYELLRDGLGEKPVEKHEQNVAFNSEKLDSVFNQLGGQGLEE